MLDFIRCRGHGGAVGYVQPDRMHSLRLATLFELGERLIDVVLAQVCQDDPHPCLDERARNSEANATRAKDADED